MFRALSSRAGVHNVAEEILINASNSTLDKTNQTYVLLIEDNRDDEDLFRFAADRFQLSCEVKTEKNGLRGLNFLQIAAERGPDHLPAVVVLDLNLPFLSGIDLIYTLRQDGRFSGLNIVVFSTSTHERDIQKSLALGVSRYFIKPSHIEGYEEIMKYLRALISG